MLGIREDLLPSDVAAAAELGDRIASRQHAGSAHGRALMAALLAGMEDHVPGLRSAPRSLVRYLVGDALADQLGVPEGGFAPEHLAALRLLPGAPARTLAGVARRLSPVVGRPLLRAVVAAKLGAAPAAFAMPA
jgi:hypothetical protein